MFLEPSHLFQLEGRGSTLECYTALLHHAFPRWFPLHPKGQTNISMRTDQSELKARAPHKEVKCVVWDLDNTLWNGTLLEPKPVRLNREIPLILAELDRRGILLSIASKNEPTAALEQLKEFKLDHYFLVPEIGWQAKSHSIKRIHETLNLGLDTFLFIDDQPFELEEVSDSHSEVRCVHANSVRNLLDRPDLNPRFVTEESQHRRHLYQEQLTRRQAEQEYQGPKASFLASLEMVFTVAPATDADLRRAEELTVRTNQLNATGRTYSYDELKACRECPDHDLLICSLQDRFGNHGHIGLALIEHRTDSLFLKLLLMSCRVMSHGVGSVLLAYVMNHAKDLGKFLEAEFVPTKRNRMMMITYRFAGFQLTPGSNDKPQLLRHELDTIPPYPEYIDLVLPNANDLICKKST
jgi:FkbH-like protein